VAHSPSGKIDADDGGHGTDLNTVREDEQWQEQRS